MAISRRRLSEVLEQLEQTIRNELLPVRRNIEHRYRGKQQSFPVKSRFTEEFTGESKTVGNMESQHRLFAERFDLETFVPNFNFGAGFDFSDSEDNNDESQNVQVAPSAEQLQEEYERQRKYCPTPGFWYAKNVYNNCIIIQKSE